MAATLKWHPNYPENNVLLMEFDGDTTIGEALDITETEGEWISTASQVIHTIVDITKVHGVPKEFLSNLPRIATMPAANHPNAGAKIVVGARGFAATALTIFSNVYRKIIIENSLANAYDHLQHKYQISFELR